ncbi:hypothetical protein AB0K18_12145 [Nonomuraea sp. NPDC049421]|uniref:hypothetical protein n=1 Tax=Nonomuraea sp. NPDC049421 TaxID=3155275 RepID=UPI00343DF711
MTEPTTTSSSGTSTTSTPATAGHLPLTVWLTPADAESVPTCTIGCCHPVSGPLARHLIAACTQLGDTVVHLSASDHQLVSAALTAGCLPVALFTGAARAGVTWTRLARTHPAHDLELTDLRATDPDDEALLADLVGRAGLTVVEQTCERPSSHGAAKAYGVAAAARLLKPGGHLAVVAGLHRRGGVVDPLPKLIVQAREAGLVYLQHIVALRHPARGERIDPGLLRRGLAELQELPACAGLPASARVHSDVLLFTRPGGYSEPRDPQAPPVDGAGAIATGGVVQVGSER